MGQGVAIENFHYFLDGNQIFSVTTKGGCRTFWHLVVSFPKACGIAHFSSD